MSLPTPLRKALALALLVPALVSSALAQTSAEVTFVSPNYIATKNVNGVVTQVYSGTDYGDAVNAAINNLTPNRTTKERVTVRAGGNSGNAGPNANLRAEPAITMKSYTIVDFQNNTLFVNPAGVNYTYKIGIKADRVNNIEIRNLRVTGWPYNGILVTGCDNVTISGVNMAFSLPAGVSGAKNGIGLRVDDATRGTTAYATGFRHEGTSSFSGNKGNHGDNHGFETASLDGAVFGNINATDSDGCALLLNTTRNATVGIVTGVRADQTFGSYAAFRCANSAGPNVNVTKVISRDSGRGFFTPTNCTDISVGSVDIRTSVSQGILLQTGGSATVGTIGVASYVMDGRQEGIRLDDSHTGSTFRQIALRGNNGGGIWESDGAGFSSYVNVDARNGEGTNTRLSSTSTFTGGFR